MIFWVLFPVFVGIWVDRSSLGLAKLAHPFHVAFLSAVMVMALQMSGGFEHSEALALIAVLRVQAAALFVPDGRDRPSLQSARDGDATGSGSCSRRRRRSWGAGPKGTSHGVGGHIIPFDDEG